MGNTSEFENILDLCVEALIKGDSVEQCLSRYPEHAGELEPLLLAAQQIIAVPQPMPSPELKSETKRALRVVVPTPEEVRLHDALDRSIDLILQGNSIRHCLDLYPELSNSLEPLLVAAVAIKQPLSLQASPRFKEEAKRRVLARVGRSGVYKWLPWVSWPRWAYRGALAAAALLIMVSAGSFTLRASSDSSPDDLLYPIKGLSESVQMKLTTSHEDEAKLHVELASRRVQEMADVASGDDHEMIGELLIKLEGHLEEATRLIEEKKIDEALTLVLSDDRHSDADMDHARVRDLLITLDKDIKMNNARLKNAMDEASPDMNAKIDEAISVVRAHYVATIAALEDKRSSEELDSLNGVLLAFRN